MNIRIFRSLIRLFLLVSSCFISPSAFALTAFALEYTLVHPAGGNWGNAVVSGDTAMVGNGTFPETVHVFERDASGQWPHIETITNSNPAGIHATSLDGDTVLMFGLVPGSTAKDRWFVYIRQGGQWVLATELVAPAGVMLGAGDSSPGRGALDGDRIVLPASQTTKANPLKWLLIYERPALGWNATTTLSPTTTVDLGNSAGDRLRLAGLEGDTVAFFAQPPLSNTPSAVRIWELVAGTWSHTATLTSSDPSLTGTVAFLDADAVIMSVLISGVPVTGQIQVFNKPAGGWQDATEGAVLSLASASTFISARGIDATTVLAHVPGLANTLLVYDAPAGAWSSTDTPTEQHVPPGGIRAPVLDGRTILAAPFIYRGPQPGVAQEADIALTKISDLITPGLHQGQQVVFTITARNLSGATATVRAHDRLPRPLTFVSAAASSGSYNPTNGMWGVGPLAPGAPAETLTIVALVEDLPPGVDPCIDNTARVFITDADIADSDASNNSPTVEMSFGDAGCTDFFVGSVAVQPIDDDSFIFSFPFFTGGPGLGASPLWFAFDLPAGLHWTDVGINGSFSADVTCEETMKGGRRTIVTCEVEVNTPFGCVGGAPTCTFDISADLDGTFSGGTVAGSACSLSTYDPNLTNNRTRFRAPRLSTECPGRP